MGWLCADKRNLPVKHPPLFFPFFFLHSCILNSTLAPQSPNFPFTHTINHKPTVWHTRQQSFCQFTLKADVYNLNTINSVAILSLMNQIKQLKVSEDRQHCRLLSWPNRTRTVSFQILPIERCKECDVEHLESESLLWGPCLSRGGLEAGLRLSLEEMECTPSDR